MQPVGTADVPGMCQAVGVDDTTEIYFLSRHGRVLGPFDPGIYQWLQETHRLDGADRVWHQGMPGWLSLSEHKQKRMGYSGLGRGSNTTLIHSRNWSDELAPLAGMAGILILLILFVPCWVFLLIGLICWGSKCK